MSKKKENIEPVYFMDLVVENVRCFKGRQVMDFSDGNGKPAQWTIILGDNGKTQSSLQSQPIIKFQNKTSTFRSK